MKELEEMMNSLRGGFTDKGVLTVNNKPITIKWLNELLEAQKAELLEKVKGIENPYPEDVFKSLNGKAARNAYEACRKDIVNLISNQ